MDKGKLPKGTISKDVFHCLNKHVKVSEAGKWVGDTWEWEWGWRRNLFVWEEENLQMLQGILMDVYPSK